ncbi:hypothetical protein AB6A40_010330 [Gnathostoma spinigerum]|uniref:CTLH domain-containing protein n=1 Tax=Gnathostoma spinigerum TaxID=75299 RepID=A0ABD6F0X6_9BILA
MGRNVETMTLSTLLSLSERDIVRLILEFLESRALHITQLSLERETGIINGSYSDDVLFLRQLILDGQWDNALDYVEPLSDVPEFDSRSFRYNITKYKFFELLCIKQEPGPMQDNDFTVEELVECMKELEHLCPSTEDFRRLCALLTLPKLSDHVDFKNWNPSSARVECFRKVEPLVADLIPYTRKPSDEDYSTNERLIQLISKGVFYEACLDYCRTQAVSDRSPSLEVHLGGLLAPHPKLSNTDVSFLSWLESVSYDQFCNPFPQKALDLKVDPIKKPKLVAQWTEQILATPIKPGGVFPQGFVPTTKLKCAENMSRSMFCSPMSTSMFAGSTFR